MENELIALIALLLSVINLFLYTISIYNDWKKSKIKILLRFPQGELKKIKDGTFIDLKTKIDVTNVGNKDTFIGSLWICHNEKSLGEKSISKMQIASKFKLPAHTNITFDVKFSTSYNPENSSSPPGYDNIFVILRDNRNKKLMDRIYYKVNEKTHKIDSFFTWDKDKDSRFLTD